MRKLIAILALVFAATACFAGVNVSSPSNGATVGTSVHFVASASGSTTIASMIIYVDGSQSYLVYSNNLDTYINVGAGSHTAVIRAWDNWGGVYSQTVSFTVSSGASTPSGSGGAGVFFSAPANGATVGSPVQVTASATPSGSSPISAMILYVDGNEAYRAYNGSINTAVPMGGGQHVININAWDNNGQLYQSAKQTINVGSGSGSSGGGSTVNGVTVSSPSPNATVGSPAHFVASAAGNGPIASMIVYIDGSQSYLVYSNSLDTNISVGAGTHTALVRAWDNYGGMYTNSFNFTVSGGGTTSQGSSGSSSVTAGNTTYNVQSLGGWDSCTVCAGEGGNGPAAGYSMEQHQGSPSLTGDASKFSVWGSTPYSDVLWWKQIVSGDSNPSANNAAHHYIYDMYFYIDNANAAQAIEFDINHFVNGHSLIFGTQCNIRSGAVWDIWDNQANRWIHTGKSCGVPAAYTWHHVTVEVERSTDGGDWLHYVSITMDDNKTYIDAWYPPASSGWKGITVNFQMDGNYAMHSYSIWVDKFSFSYY